MIASIFSLILTLSPANDSTVFNPGDPTAVNKTRVLRLVNELRSKGAKCGDTYYHPAPAMSWNDQLEQAAQAHSNDMAARKYFNHFSPEGENAGERIDRAGYRWKSFGENIGLGYRTEEEVIEGWRKSPSHCKNMMNPQYTEMAVARNGEYWTQNLGSK